MQKVNSFIVDHTVLQPGIYVTEVNGVFTYDIRFVAPRDAVGKGLFMTPQSAHTFEHFMADYMRTKHLKSSQKQCCMWVLWAVLQDFIFLHL